MKTLHFAKIEGAGNDFVVLDNRQGQVPEPLSKFAALVCDRRRSVGGDGLLLVESSGRKAFRMRYFNADGSEADMCGNGARCIVLFANKIGAAGPKTDFENLAGDFGAEILKDGRITIQMTKPTAQKLDWSVDVDGKPVLGHFLNTGVPHFVVPVEDVEKAPVFELGRKLRRHEVFAPKGSNINFAQVTGPNEVKLRTYERGVEDETLACGTGITAAGILLAQKGLVKPPVKVHTRGHDVVEIGFSMNNGEVTNVTMTGPAKIAFEGDLDLDQLLGR